LRMPVLHRLAARRCREVRPLGGPRDVGPLERARIYLWRPARHVPLHERQRLRAVTAAEALHDEGAVLTVDLEREEVLPLRHADVELADDARSEAEQPERVVLETPQVPHTRLELGLCADRRACEPLEQVDDVNALVEQL